MEEKIMNVLVIGPSGAGKSTLIRAISGKKVKSGIGEGQTQSISIYDSNIWPLRLIDTKGFEYNWIEKLKTVNQVRKYTKKQALDSDDVGIDAIWYCIDGMTGRVFFENIKTMSKAIKGWNNIPIFAILTKSIVEENIETNTRAVQNAFAKSKGMNLKGIIPIVAEEYKVGENIIEPFGLEELCNSTLDCYEEAKKINFSNRKSMIISQKRFTSQAITVGSVTAATVVGVSPLLSEPVLVPIEINLIQSIFKIYGIKMEKSFLKSFVTTGGVSAIGKGLAAWTTKLIPGVNLIYGVVAGVIVTALGESTIVVAEKIYKGEMDPNKLDNITKEITKSMKTSLLIDSLKTYLNSNKDNINNKSSIKDIINEVTKNKK